MVNVIVICVMTQVFISLYLFAGKNIIVRVFFIRQMSNDIIQFHI